MVAISRAWYNGSYTIAAKPIKFLEIHYTMIQFLIMNHILQPGQSYNKMYGTEPRYNKILVKMRTVQNPKRKMYPDITNKIMSTHDSLKCDGLKCSVLSERPIR